MKARYQGEPGPAPQAGKRRQGNTTGLLVTQVPGERPTVVITTPAIGHVPPRPVLMFSCVDNITRMQVALMHPLDVHDIAVTLMPTAGHYAATGLCARTAPCWSPAGGYPVSMKLSNCSAQKR
ncbi:putative type VI secretion system protein [Escherichia coli]|uniref:Putative type VI secretion system protein n=1 Tax=Escherichia coli TaxID=562 RepID=A0A376VMY0_ECOLX|nr:putative type VI secretion system protein [Escherichia coli]